MLVISIYYEGESKTFSDKCHKFLLCLSENILTNLNNTRYSLLLLLLFWKTGGVNICFKTYLGLSIPVIYLVNNFINKTLIKISILINKDDHNR